MRFTCLVGLYFSVYTLYCHIFIYTHYVADRRHEFCRCINAISFSFAGSSTATVLVTLTFFFKFFTPKLTIPRECIDQYKRNENVQVKRNRIRLGFTINVSHVN